MSDDEEPLRTYRDGRVHVLAEQCATCVFRPGDLMHLGPARRAELVRENADSALTCHATLYRDDVDHAVCRGFFDRYQTLPLRLAVTLGVITWDPVPDA